MDSTNGRDAPTDTLGTVTVSDQPAGPCLWFGKHKGIPLPDVPTDYLLWALATVKLSSGIWAAAVAELASRGIQPPLRRESPSACWRGPCHRCGDRQVNYRWHEYRNGVRQVRASCARCGQQLGHAPRTSPYTDEADRHASETPTLDVLLLAEQEGVKIVSDGQQVHCEPWGKASEKLKDLVRQCGHQL